MHGSVENTLSECVCTISRNDYSMKTICEQVHGGNVDNISHASVMCALMHHASMHVYLVRDSMESLYTQGSTMYPRHTRYTWKLSVQLLHTIMQNLNNVIVAATSVLVLCFMNVHHCHLREHQPSYIHKLAPNTRSPTFISCPRQLLVHTCGGFNIYLGF